MRIAIGGHWAYICEMDRIAIQIVMFVAFLPIVGLMGKYAPEFRAGLWGIIIAVCVVIVAASAVAWVWAVTRR